MQSFEGGKGVRHVGIREKWVLVRGNSNCINYEIAAFLVCSRNRKETSVCGSGGENKVEIKK